MKREACSWIWGDVLWRQYELCGKLDNLITFAGNNEKICSFQNERMNKQGETDVSREMFMYVLREIRRVTKATKDSKSRSQS